ncbi:HAD family hydrolase [Pseudonocardia kunmingensis]|uniref:Haloacid dehalogenase-like hydrolase n=1 Tax=Pseudonocardia kunmingensis TaxID=630975 RepID=A0A543CYU8_9PSEU|nr:HAD family hydrolase [Pseudonocardia kunmingensis]TQM02273.1 haloacid dehalogenase-like hydrolase [Pseudonocardia kunmingensis]
MTLRRAESLAVAVVGVVAVATLGYRLGAGAPAVAAFATALAVLLVAAPVALHLATATPLLVAAGRGARLGLLLPDASAGTLRVDTVVVAGTEVLTTGGPEVQEVRLADGVGRHDALRMAGSVAQESARPVDRAVAAASEALLGVAEFDAVDDLGSRGIVAEVVTDEGGEPMVIAHAVLVGEVELLTAHGIALPAELAGAPAQAVAAGRTPVAVAWDGVARAVLAVGGAVAASHAAAVHALRELGVRPVLLAAQAEPAARYVAGRCGIDPEAVHAGLSGEDEAAVVHRLRACGARVAVVAEATHAAALAAADLAVRTDPAAPAHHGLPAAVDAIRLAHRATGVARANVAWSLACTAAALPAAATGVLGPVLAAAATATSALVVVANSLRLQRFGTTGG